MCVKADPDTGEFLFPINQIKKVLPGLKFADDCAAAGGVPFGPTMALLGTVDPHTDIPPRCIGQTPLRKTQYWVLLRFGEIHNHTEDAHPIHIHMVQFEVLDRTPMGDQIGGPTTRGPEPWETGTKDTVIALPDEVIRVKALYDIPGLFVWHCHILEHEDNEMMRSYCVGDMANCNPVI